MINLIALASSLWVVMLECKHNVTQLARCDQRETCMAYGRMYFDGLTPVEEKQCEVNVSQKKDTAK